MGHSLYLSGLTTFHDTPSCSEVHLFSPLQFSFIQYDTVCCYIFMWVDCLKVCSFYLNDTFPRSGTLPSCSLFYSRNYSGIPFNLGELNHTCQVCALNKSLPSLHHPVATLASDDLPLRLVLSKYFFVGGCWTRWWGNSWIQVCGKKFDIFRAVVISQVFSSFPSYPGPA